MGFQPRVRPPLAGSLGEPRAQPCPHHSSREAPGTAPVKRPEPVSAVAMAALLSHVGVRHGLPHPKVPPLCAALLSSERVSYVKAEASCHAPSVSESPDQGLVFSE